MNGADPRAAGGSAGDPGPLAAQDVANPYGIIRISTLNGNLPGFESPLPVQDGSLAERVGGDPFAAA